MADDSNRAAHKPEGRGLMLIAAVFYGAVAIVVMAAARIRPEMFGFKVFPSDAGSALLHLVAGSAAAALVVAVSWALVKWTAAGMRLARRQAAAVADVPTYGVFALAFLAGVVEEVFFRGALWSLVASLLGPWPALAVTAFLFGVVHGGFRPGRVLWSLIAVASGVIAGLLLMWSGALLAPMVMHVLVDAVDIPLLKRKFRASAAR